MGTWITLTYPEAESYNYNWYWIEKAMAYIVQTRLPHQKRNKNRGNDYGKKEHAGIRQP